MILTILEHFPTWVSSLFWIAIGFGAAANILTWSIVADTNRTKDTKESYLGWYFGKMDRIFNEYEQKFPTGRKVFWFKVCFIAAGWSLGLYPLLGVLFSSR